MSLPKRSLFGIRVRVALTLLTRAALIILNPLLSRVRHHELSRQRHKGIGANSCVPITVLLIYRAKNTTLVETLLNQLGPTADVRLWALDQIAPELAEFTIGVGSGMRFKNLNRLLDARKLADDSWLVVADDDVFFSRGSLNKMILAMKFTGISFAQPGHSPLSWWTCLFNIGRPFLLGRDTNYVEQGPLFVSDPAFVKVLTPFPAWDDMGWGSSALWYRAKENRYRIGIIDCCRIIHWTRANSAYPEAPELDRLQQRLEALGIESNWQLHSENQRWWQWGRKRLKQ